MTETTAPARTQDEIVARIAEIKDRDWMGIETLDLAVCLDFEHVKQFLKEGVTAEEWKDGPALIAGVKDRARDYLQFAMSKADDHRGLSAMRSIDHYRAWSWLSGNAAFIAAVETVPYGPYGAPILSAIATALGLQDVWAEHTTPELDRMAQGLPCEPGCVECAS